MEREPRITDEQANAYATQSSWPAGTELTITKALMWLGADLLDARSRLAVQKAKVAMYERWMREHTPSCPLLAENIVEPPSGLHRLTRGSNG